MLSECCFYPLKSARFKQPPFAGCWLRVDAELAIGQAAGAWNLWYKQLPM